MSSEPLRPRGYSALSETDLDKARENLEEARRLLARAERILVREGAKIPQRPGSPTRNRFALAVQQERDGWKVVRARRRVEKLEAHLAGLQADA